MYNRIVRKSNILREILIKALSHKKECFYLAYLATASRQLGMGLVSAISDINKFNSFL